MCDLRIAGLAVVRGLGRMGVTVVGADSANSARGRFSRYCRFARCPDVLTDEAKYIDWLLSLGGRLPGRPVLLPTKDETVVAVSRHRESLAERFFLSLPDPSVARCVASKASMGEFFGRHGEAIPKTWSVQTEQQAIKAASLAGWPCLLKPTGGTEFRRRFAAKLFVCEDEGQLRLRFRQAAGAGIDTLIQEYIPGPDCNMYSFVSHAGRDGRGRCVVAGLVMRRLRGWPVGFGTSTLVESAGASASSREIFERGRAIVTALGYRGISEIEFKRDARDGTLRLIEMNPRPWWQIDLAVRCGMNLPYRAYRDAAGLPATIMRPASQLPNRRWWYARFDLRAARQALREGRMSRLGWLWSLRRTRSFAFFDRTDPLPWLVELAAWAAKSARQLLR